MSLARHFTGRRKNPEMEISDPMPTAHLGRAAGQRAGRPVVRNQISSPMALTSTSNMQVHNARNIAGAAPIEIQHIGTSDTSSNSDEDGNGSSGFSENNYASTDASSVDESPIKSEPEPNHLSCYFKPAVDTHSPSHSRSPSSSQRPSFDSRPSFEAPTLPQRAPSHSKKAHEGLHRKRSVQRMFSPPPGNRTSHENAPRNSNDFFGSQQSNNTFVEAPRDNPFGNELAQLDEVAEEFGHVVQKVELDADAKYMMRRGLARFDASEYTSAIAGLVQSYLHDEPASARSNDGWF